jgi:hypothetical protein
MNVTQMIGTTMCMGIVAIVCESAHAVLDLQGGHILLTKPTYRSPAM